jgi:hypothetical protein
VCHLLLRCRTNIGGWLERLIVIRLGGKVLEGGAWSLHGMEPHVGIGNIGKHQYPFPRDLLSSVVTIWSSVGAVTHWRQMMIVLLCNFPWYNNHYVLYNFVVAATHHEEVVVERIKRQHSVGQYIPKASHNTPVFHRRRYYHRKPARISYVVIELNITVTGYGQYTFMSCLCSTDHTFAFSIQACTEANVLSGNIRISRLLLAGPDGRIFWEHNACW